MWLFCLLAVIVCFYGIKMKRASNISESLSVDNTTALKGVFILLVFFSHFNSYVTYTAKIDLVYLRMIDWIGQSMVAVFLFLSGYGVMESIQKKPKYISSIPYKRVLATLFRFDIAVVIYAVVSVAMGNAITWKQMALSLVAWSKVGNSNWYIFDILALYTMTYAVFIWHEKKKLSIGQALAVLGGVSVLFMIAMRVLKGSFWWWDTVACYIVGMAVSYHKNTLDRVVNRHWLKLTVLSVLLTVVFKYLIRFGDIFRIFANIGFVVSVVLLTNRLILGNAALKWLGKHLFEIYILMRLPMMLLQNTGIGQNRFVYFVLCFLATAILAYLYRPAIDFLWKKTIYYFGKKLNTKKTV